MSIEDLSNEFDVIVNSHSFTMPFGLTSNPLNFNEYEKSVFLTKAQEEYAYSLYSGKNIFKDSFERTEDTRKYLSPLIKTEVKKPLEDETLIPVTKKSVFFNMPEDVWFVTYEVVKLQDNIGCMSGAALPVIPSTQDELHRLNKNPFRGSNGRRALRFDVNNNIAEIVCDFPIDSYKIRYIRRPIPIILVDLNDTNLSIDGHKDKFEGDLTLLHHKIVETAALMAIKSRMPQSANNNSNNNSN